VTPVENDTTLLALDLMLEKLIKLKNLYAFYVMRGLAQEMIKLADK